MNEHEANFMKYLSIIEKLHQRINESGSSENDIQTLNNHLKEEFETIKNRIRVEINRRGSI